ncbi:FAD-binding oxidoreductase [Hazenella sp. IB182353]|uniref:FAD-binding oxidoreductase n=1 Tax=Polycladospora coralii TaxID=2771432 RepID=UPI001746B922|nr:FAD-binding oxidoreductase [Polycladospora coralii]MBS7529631.1 FAD-binding oxidoreductase [Polycladospora coralii]
MFEQAIIDQIGKHKFSDKDKVLHAYRQNASQLVVEIKGILFPDSAQDVKIIIQLANQYHKSLYPIGTGKNWGLGSRLPVGNGAYIVDLKRMNRIIEVNETHGYAVIEPGVTQDQLYQYLKARQLPFILNVTGSAASTSIIGNALDRGIGHFGPRVEDISNLEVVTGNGQVIHTGMGRFHNSKTTSLYPYGIGPDITGLFFQSNFGIVLKASVQLLFQTELSGVIRLTLKDYANLVPFMDQLIALRRAGVFHATIHLSNPSRSQSVLSPLLFDQFLQKYNDLEKAKQKTRIYMKQHVPPLWSANLTVRGSSAAVKQAYHQVKKQLAHLATVQVETVQSRQRALRRTRIFSFLPGMKERSLFLKATNGVFGHSQGIPSDDSLKSVEWEGKMEKSSFSVELDKLDVGTLFVLPTLPLSGNAVKDVMKQTHDIMKEKYGFIPYMTFNMINERSIEAVINLVFDKQDDQKSRLAHQCIEEMQATFIEKGYIPYRTGIQLMDQVYPKQTPYDGFYQQLKQMFDPNDCIAPGRYGYKQ